jgi:hypothetical protein
LPSQHLHRTGLEVNVSTRRAAAGASNILNVVEEQFILLNHQADHVTELLTQLFSERPVDVDEELAAARGDSRVLSTCLVI